MASYLRQKPPVWFWIVAIVLLLWGAMGCYACLQQFRLGADAMGPADAYYRTLYATLPAWYNWVYAVAVGAGFLGAIALLMRLATARLLFIVSLIAVVVQFGWLFATTDMIAVRGAGATVPFPLFIVAVAAFAIWLSGHARRRGWIG
ncbi:hypothetical protein M9980_02710 [Sphingomonas donggukensis]|uniref:Sugar transporter n=1 Tax=Sphingomonas donggukensis TaxID=2949093 RepID=A0ABY4TUS8_9SPHN|nr:hypothetical protein [Sphingomonas donggukensis]URW76160.1 hypothetical protein M9980_02710 [Sphingomonas donggukensis]